VYMFRGCCELCVSVRVNNHLPCKNSTGVLTGGVKEVGVSPLSIDEDAGGEPALTPVQDHTLWHWSFVLGSM